MNTIHDFHYLKLKQGQCFIKRYNKWYTDKPHFFAFVENNDNKYYNMSKNFIDNYGLVLEHFTIENDIELLLIPYSTVDDEENPKYVENNIKYFIPNAVNLIMRLYDICNPSLEINSMQLTRENFIRNTYQTILMHINNMLPYEKSNIINTSDDIYNKLKFIAIISSISLIFFGIENCFCSNDYGNSLGQLCEQYGVTYYRNPDYILIEFLCELNIAGWVRLIYQPYSESITTKQVQEIAICPSHLHLIIPNIGCNCNIIDTTCNKIPFVYNSLQNTTILNKKSNIDDLRIMTLNVDKWIKHYEKKIPTAMTAVILENILDLDPDIICFQNDNKVNFLSTNYTKQILIDLFSNVKQSFDNKYMCLTEGYKYNYIDQTNYSSCSIFIKKTLDHNYDFDLSKNTNINNGTQNCCATVVVVTHKTNLSDKFVLVNTHLHSGTNFANIDFGHIDTHITEFSNLPILILGDFNTYIKSDYTENQLDQLIKLKHEKISTELDDNPEKLFLLNDFIGTDKKYCDVFEHNKNTYGISIPVNTTIFGGKSDYIIGNNKFFSDYNTIPQQYNKFISTHTPLIVDISIKNVLIGGNIYYNKFKKYKNKNTFLKNYINNN